MPNWEIVYIIVMKQNQHIMLYGWIPYTYQRIYNIGRIKPNFDGITLNLSLLYGHYYATYISKRCRYIYKRHTILYTAAAVCLHFISLFSRLQ